MQSLLACRLVIHARAVAAEEEEHSDEFGFTEDRGGTELELDTWVASTRTQVGGGVNP